MSSSSIVEFLAVVLTSLALAPAMAHVMELPNKLPMSRDAYLTVQRVYRGWQFVGIIVVGALVSTLLLMLSSDGDSLVPAITAFSAILATQVVFWTVTFPVNRRTRNWTLVPKDWEGLRDRWEYSHAASALLNFIAVVSVALAILSE
jgi:hypothetical protein